MEDLKPRWNIFARELQDIMRSRKHELGVIDDHTSIHQEKVRRLQKSLATPKRFPLLSPGDLDMLIEAFALTPDEIIRLRAAILATSVEATLMGRIQQPEALRAAEQVFEIAVKSLRSDDRAFQDVRTGGEYMQAARPMQAPDVQDDTPVVLDPALAALDWGTLAMHLALQSSNHTQRVTYLQLARAAFGAALHSVDALEDVTLTAIWREEANRGLDGALAELEDSGG